VRGDRILRLSVLVIHNLFHRLMVSQAITWSLYPNTTMKRSTSNVAITLGLVARLVIAFEQVGEAGGIVQKCQVELADGAVALLGYDDLGSTS
jgi:hypothetical protein